MGRLRLFGFVARMKGIFLARLRFFTQFCLKRVADAYRYFNMYVGDDPSRFVVFTPPQLYCIGQRLSSLSCCTVVLWFGVLFGVLVFRCDSTVSPVVLS